VDEIFDEAANSTWKEDPFSELPPVSRDDPSTWTSKHGWPGAASVGIFGGSASQGPMAFKNRTNPRMYDVFKHLLDKEKLWVSMDRFGVMKPTTNVLLKDGITRQDFPAYKVH
jgi:hypothetical protein